VRQREREIWGGKTPTQEEEGKREEGGRRERGRRDEGVRKRMEGVGRREEEEG